MKSLLRHLRHTLVALVWLSLAARVAVPAGFMPAGPEDGLTIKLCPGVAQGLHSAEDSHPLPSSAGDSGPETSDEHTPCPLGVLFASAFFVESVDLQPSPATQAETVPAARSALPQRSLDHRPQPRGPPFGSSYST